MLGTKFYKGKYDLDAYAAAAEWCNNNNCTIVDRGEYYEVIEAPAPTKKELNAIRIAQLKMELTATDYQCLKYVDGEITEKAYAKIKEQRAKWRKEINALEK